MDEFPSLVHQIVREDGITWYAWAKNSEEMLNRFIAANGLVITETDIKTEEYWSGKLFQSYLSEEEAKKYPEDKPLRYVIEPAPDNIIIFDDGNE